ncbi:hypothetical protein SHEEN_40 [Mycobacterium phage Sheen]|uniref:Uncharacterized protein n=1 Tax=Mycobacterium phage Sheen TaxID=1589274 RepID=A0A0B5A0W2_9CAUD|nr:hypothetical protein AVV31_gp54 [Mycobacterium phage Sheen]AJD82458.1 hypothetical protein SHEEN_40 [Mycobacterium phage Sheen]
MKISELIVKLVALKADHGDVEVYTEDGCGCCMGSREPNPEFHEEDRYYGYQYRNGIAL